jgi:3',5'-cyclic AMP phosphodiesterase CpdA
MDASAASASVGCRLVLLGDIHVYRLMLAPWHLASKRVLGQLNLWLNRRVRLRRDLLGTLVDRVNALQPGAILGSGDLTTTALPGEFEMIRTALAPLLERYPTFLVPGNHDRYTFSSARTRRFEANFEQWTSSSWPHARRLCDGVDLLGLDPTRPTLLHAHGELGKAQRDAAVKLIDNLPEPPRPLVVLCHYPIGEPAGERPESPHHGLRDARALVELLPSDRPVLYVHGHVHRPWCYRRADKPNILAINTGAPLMTAPRWPVGQGFWQVDVDPAAEEPWRLTHHVMHSNGRWMTESAATPREGGEAVELLAADGAR